MGAAVPAVSEACGSDPAGPDCPVHRPGTWIREKDTDMKEGQGVKERGMEVERRRRLMRSEEELEGQGEVKD